MDPDQTAERIERARRVLAQTSEPSDQSDDAPKDNVELFREEDDDEPQDTVELFRDFAARPPPASQ
jgi:hypothetical protein